MNTCIKRGHSLNKLTPPHYIIIFTVEISKSFSWILQFTKATDPLLRQCLMYALVITSSQLKLFSTRTCLRVTHLEKRGPKSSQELFNSSKTICEERIKHFKTHLLDRGYAENFIQEALSEVHFKNRKLALQQK